MWRSILAFRCAHEPDRAKLVAPHITLVFGVQNSTPSEIAEHCERVARRTTMFCVEFSSWEIVYDPFEKTHKIFLVTSTGTDRVTALHQHLYDGPHRSEQRTDIPYKAHMTVATNVDRSVLEAVDVASLGRFPIKATIRSLEVVSLANGRLTVIGSFPLAA
ncbi:MAG: 2'-5' RNA ligase family protein [Pikeienuella sp.]